MLDTTRKMIQFPILSSFYLFIPVKQVKSEQKKVPVGSNMSWSVSYLLDTDSVLWVPGTRYFLYQYTVPGSQYVNIPLYTSNS